MRFLAPAPLCPQVRGFLEQGHNRFERPLLHGHWDSEMYADMPDGSTVRMAAICIPCALQPFAMLASKQGRAALAVSARRRCEAGGQACNHHACLAMSRGPLVWSRASHHHPRPRPPQVLLWRKNPPPPEPTRYNLTAFRCGGVVGSVLPCVLGWVLHRFTRS